MRTTRISTRATPRRIGRRRSASPTPKAASSPRFGPGADRRGVRRRGGRRRHHLAELSHHPHQPGRQEEEAYRSLSQRALGRAVRDAVDQAAAAGPALEQEPRRQRRGAAGECARARRRAARFRRQGRDHQCPPRTRGHALRARARARHQVLARDRPCRRHRPLDERGRHPRRRRARPQRHRHRASQRSARNRDAARDDRVCRFPGSRPQARARARQEYRRRADHRRSLAHAASPHRRHHRLGQVGRHQHHDPVAALPAVARAVQIHHDRSEDARAVGL